jgi:penicillin-binding protein 1A
MREFRTAPKGGKVENSNAAGGRSEPRHQSAQKPNDAEPMQPSDRLIYEPEPEARPPRSLSPILMWGARIGGGLVVAMFLAFAGLYALIRASEPVLPLDSDLYALNRPAAYTFLDKNGNRLGVRGAIAGERLNLSDMPPYLPAAFLTVEDRRFYEHNGVDIYGLLRAARADLAAGRVVQGGSSITQQLVKMLLLTPDRTFSRKIVEVAGALAIERRLSKNQILELYLNRIYLGAGAYGVDGAARVYFGKPARNLTLAEAAMLAALTTAPSTFSPRRDFQAAQERADHVLASMAAAGAIGQNDLAEARAHPAKLMAIADENGTGYFLDLAAEEAKQLAGDAKGDLVVATTFDPAMQKAAHASLTGVMDKNGAKLNAAQASIVSMSTSGAIVALVGGRNYNDSAFNRVTQAHRQPGSAFKPMVYLTALEYGLHPWTVRTDEPITIKGWSPDNYGGTHRGDVSLTEALARSINSVAVELGQEVGLKKVIATAKRLGIQSTLEPNPSLPLGTSEVTPLELTGAFGSFATAGQKVTPYAVSEIRNATGTYTWRRPDIEGARVIDQDTAMTLNGMMYQVVQWGTGAAAKVPGYEVAGKTGTSTDYHDAWFIGFSSNMVTGVWVGNDDSSPMKKVTGGALPAQIWTGFMRVALKGTKPVALPKKSPPPPDATAVIAGIDPQDNESPGMAFDGIGNFFDRLFDSRAQARTPPPPPQAYQPPPSRYDERQPYDGRGYRTYQRADNDASRYRAREYRGYPRDDGQDDGREQYRRYPPRYYRPDTRYAAPPPPRARDYYDYGYYGR